MIFERATVSLFLSASKATQTAQLDAYPLHEEEHAGQCRA